MSGTCITDQQVLLYMNNRKHHPQKLAAAKSGMSERTLSLLRSEGIVARGPNPIEDRHDTNAAGNTVDGR